MDYKTGNWRDQRPVIDQESCKKCGICRDVCPDDAVKVKDEQYEIDYDFCKGCGICANECPVNRKVERKGVDESGKAITMHKEVEFE